jgi:hypothetical protein
VHYWLVYRNLFGFGNIMFDISLVKLGCNAARAALISAVVLGASVTKAEVQLGDPSVVSQRGQRLKIALPYGSNPGERVPVLRFTIEDVKVPEGYKAPAARGFTMLQGESRNIVTLLSREIVDAPSMSMVVKVANQTGENSRSYVVNIPENRSALTEAPPVEAKKANKGGSKKKARAYKRKIVVQNDLPPK